MHRLRVWLDKNMLALDTDVEIYTVITRGNRLVVSYKLSDGTTGEICGKYYAVEKLRGNK